MLLEVVELFPKWVPDNLSHKNSFAYHTRLCTYMTKSSCIWIGSIHTNKLQSEILRLTFCNPKCFLKPKLFSVFLHVFKLVSLCFILDLLYRKIPESGYKTGWPISREMGGIARYEISEDCPVLSRPWWLSCAASGWRWKCILHRVCQQRGRWRI